MNDWLTFQLSIFAEPLLGGLIEWSLILIWIGSWAVIAFVATDVGYTITEINSDYDLPIILACVGWICFYSSTLLLLYLFRTHCRRQYPPHGLIQARLYNLGYHFLRWPIFVGLLALPEDWMRFCAFAVDWFAYLVILIIAPWVLICCIK